MKKRYIGMVLVWGLSLLGRDATPTPWTKCYRRVLSDQERQLHEKKNIFMYARYGVAPFTQLIVSWNAERLLQGHFTFSVSARDARTKAWGGWHTMYKWGAGQSRSYINTTQGLTSYYYVRLEVDPKKTADAFRVRVQACNGASLRDLYSLTVSTANFTLFKTEVYDTSLVQLPSVYIDKVPLYSQFSVDYADQDRICSPTSCSMVARYVTGKPINIATVAGHVYDDGLQAYGSWPFNTAYLFELLQGQFWTMVVRLPSFARLHTYLMRGIPVIVSVRGSLSGAPKSYDNGHLLVVVGWDARKQLVICHDPAAKTANAVLKRYALRDFLAAWERSRRLTYCIEPR